MAALLLLFLFVCSFRSNVCIGLNLFFDFGIFKNKDEYIIVAGILSALLFLSSTSASPFIAVQAVALYLLFYGQPGALKKVFVFIATMYLTIAPLFSVFL